MKIFIGIPQVLILSFALYALAKAYYELAKKDKLLKDCLISMGTVFIEVLLLAWGGFFAGHQVRITGGYGAFFFGIPQILYFVLAVISILLSAQASQLQKAPAIVTNIIGVFIRLGLLWWGGFFTAVNV